MDVEALLTVEPHKALAQIFTLHSEEAISADALLAEREFMDYFVGTVDGLSFFDALAHGGDAEKIIEEIVPLVVSCFEKKDPKKPVETTGRPIKDCWGGNLEGARTPIGQGETHRLPGE